MNKRVLFGKPIREDTTKSFYPRKMTIEDFEESLLRRDLIEEFMSNMRNLGGKAIKLKYIEQWVEQFLAWSEIEVELNKKRQAFRDKIDSKRRQNDSMS